MKSIYDIIVEDLGSKKAWGNLVYNVLGYEDYMKLTYRIAVIAAKANVKTGQQTANNGQSVNTYPADWLRMELNAELSKLGINVQVKQKAISSTPSDMLEELAALATKEKTYGDWTLSILGRKNFYDKHAFRVFFHILNHHINNGYNYVTEHEVCKSMDNKTMRGAVSNLRNVDGWSNIKSLRGYGYKIVERESKLNDPIVELVNKIVSSIK